MKLNVPFLKKSDIPKDLVDELLLTINSEHWYISNVRNSMSNLENTQSIIMRYFNDYEKMKADPANFLNYVGDFPIYEHYRNVVNKIKLELSKHYEYKNYMMFLAKLLPHKNVGTHCDSGPFLETCHRIHIPIKTNPNVCYNIEDTSYYWETGGIYEFDNTRLHSVANNSSEDRIHLMFNLYK